ncbi:MAG: MraY family glycosyltransferase [bacterium]
MINLETFQATYTNLLPMFLFALILSALLSPVMGFLAMKFGLIDLPASLRNPADKSMHKVLHDRIVPKSGGLAVITAFVITLICFVPLSPSLIGILLGVLVLFVIGVLDDKYDLSGKIQLLGHFIAALLVVVSGNHIIAVGASGLFSEINMAVSQINLFSIGDVNYFISLPSDLFTIAWIMIVINAIAWIDALDGLQTGVCIIITATVGIISLASGNVLVAVLSVILLASLLGFLPFNFLPGKAFNGTVGSHIYGYLIAVIAIIGSAKSVSSVLVLLVPLIDMVWVLIGRINTHLQINPIKLLSISDKTHLQHRLLDLGFSKLQVIIAEYLLVGFFAIITISRTGSDRITDFSTFIFIIVSLFLVITVLIRRRKKHLEEVKKKKTEESSPSPSSSGPTDITNKQSPEKKYAY